MKQTITWLPVEEKPEGDVYTGLVAVAERNPNYDFHVKMGIPTAEYNEFVLPAIFVFSEDKWMHLGRDITSMVEYWTIPTYPKFNKR